MSATLQVIQSGSSANGYILTCGENKLILEAGCKIKDYLNALNYDITTVAGICVSHWHSDHSRSIKALQYYGLKVYSSADVAALNPKVEILGPMQRYTIGGFKVLPLEVPHGDCPNYAYHITMPDGQTLLFYTDCSDFRYKLPNVNFILGEVNFSDNVILDNLCNGYDVRSQYGNHMSLDTAVSVIRRLYSPVLSKVICCHLSFSNADTSEIRRRFKSELGIDVETAEPNKIFSL